MKIYITSFILIGLATLITLWPKPDEPIGGAPIDGASLKAEDMRPSVIKPDYDCTQPNFDIKSIDLNKLNGKTLYACNFSQEKPDTRVFPDNMKGATFICSNLDNVYIPEGNTIIDNNGTCGSRKRYKTDDKGEDWLIDENNNYVEKINEALN